ncbi:MAG: (2Fe-2S)-binding protein [Thermomicrobiales bacterium]
MTKQKSVRINGRERVIPPAWLGARLLDFLRTELGLVGSKEGCGEGDCGACTVLFDGEPACACLLLCDITAGREIITVEGLPDQYVAQFADSCERNGGVQCGFCTSGIAVMGSWLYSGGTETGNESTADLLEGNICRCGAYQQMIKSLDGTR